MQFLKSGVYLESDYPYEGARSSCRISNVDPVFSLDSRQQLVEWYSGSKDDLYKALRQGPLSLAIGASDDFMYYSTGVFDGTCVSLNHAVDGFGFGYDEATGLDYILVRNSWGSGWGEQGYAKMVALDAKNGKCDLYKHPSYPVIA